jgi:hypothetical protein
MSDLTFVGFRALEVTVRSGLELLVLEAREYVLEVSREILGDRCEQSMGEQTERLYIINASKFQPIMWKPGTGCRTVFEVVLNHG